MPNVTVYIMTTWRNLPTKTSPIDATNLNHLEQGIKNVTDFVNTLNAESGLYLSQTPFTTLLKNKLDGIEANANNYTLPTASTSTKGGVKVDGVTISIDQNGVISSIASSTSLSALTDVNLTDLADGQILKYDATNHKWVNTSEAEVRTQLSLLEDVDIDDQTLADGQVLKYNGTSEKWENGDSGDVLDYNDTMDALGRPNPISGDGSGYRRTVLYQALPGVANTIVQLNDDITNYDRIEVLALTSNNYDRTVFTVDTDYFVNSCPYSAASGSGFPHILMVIFSNILGRMVCGPTNDKIRVFECQNGFSVIEIAGIKY